MSYDYNPPFAVQPGVDLVSLIDSEILRLVPNIIVLPGLTGSTGYTGYTGSTGLPGYSTNTGSTGPTGPTLYTDNVFEVVNYADQSKIYMMNVGNVSTSTTRTFTVPDNNGLFPIYGNNSISLGTINHISQGSYNTVIGGSVTDSSTNSNNVILGYNAGTNLTCGNNNIVIGSNAQPLSSSSNYSFVVGDTNFNNNNITKVTTGTGLANALHLVSGTTPYGVPLVYNNALMLTQQLTTSLQSFNYGTQVFISQPTFLTSTNPTISPNTSTTAPYSCKYFIGNVQEIFRSIGVSQSSVFTFDTGFSSNAPRTLSITDQYYIGTINLNNYVTLTVPSSVGLQGVLKLQYYMLMSNNYGDGTVSFSVDNGVTFTTLRNFTGYLNTTSYHNILYEDYIQLPVALSYSLIITWLCNGQQQNSSGYNMFLNNVVVSLMY